MSDAPNVIGQGAEFDAESTPFKPQAPEEVKEPTADEAVEETETQAELPADAASADEQPADAVGEDTEPEVPQDVLQREVARATKGLRDEIVDLRTELATATGNDRKIAQE